MNSSFTGGAIWRRNFNHNLVVISGVFLSVYLFLIEIIVLFCFEVFEGHLAMGGAVRLDRWFSGSDSVEFGQGRMVIIQYLLIIIIIITILI